MHTLTRFNGSLDQQITDSPIGELLLFSDGLLKAYRLLDLYISHGILHRPNPRSMVRVYASVWSTYIQAQADLDHL